MTAMDGSCGICTIPARKRWIKTFLISSFAFVFGYYFTMHITESKMYKKNHAAPTGRIPRLSVSHGVSGVIRIKNEFTQGNSIEDVTEIWTEKPVHTDYIANNLRVRNNELIRSFEETPKNDGQTEDEMDYETEEDTQDTEKGEDTEIEEDELKIKGDEGPFQPTSPNGLTEMDDGRALRIAETLAKHMKYRQSVEDLAAGEMPTNNRNIHLYTEEEVRSHPPDPKNRVFPHVLIVGARKAGTSALRDFLSLHPDINSPRSEPGWFFRDSEYAKGLDYYRTKLPRVKKNQISIEKSAEYFHCPQVPERVHAFNSSIKLLLIVRDPYARVVSDYMFLRRYLKKENCIEKDLSFEDIALDHQTNRVNSKWGCIKRSVYSIWYQQWMKYFPRRQIHIVDGESFTKGNPGRELTKVEQFLGVRPLLSEKRFYFNETKGFYCVKSIGCLQDTKGHQPLSVEPYVEQKIRDYFKPYNERFYELAGRDFGWE